MLARHARLSQTRLVSNPCLTWRPTRRQVTLGLALSAVAPRARAEPLPAALGCTIFRNNSKIGTAAYQFLRQQNALSVTIMVDLRIRLGFITLFRYQHHNQESWRGGNLVWFSARSNRNGAHEFAQGSWNGTGLMVQGSGVHPYLAPAGAIDTSYWNFRTVSAPLINAQTGRLLKATIRKIGPSAAPRADGTAIPATEYAMTGDIHLNLWYAAERLTGMEYFAHDGSVLRYEIG